jgi:hypothetical protein
LIFEDSIILKNQIIIKFAKKDFSIFFPSQKFCSLGKKNAIGGGGEFQHFPQIIIIIIINLIITYW